MLYDALEAFKQREKLYFRHMMEPNPPHIPTPVPRPAQAQQPSPTNYPNPLPQTDHPQVPPSPSFSTDPRFSQPSQAGSHLATARVPQSPPSIPNVSEMPPEPPQPPTATAAPIPSTNGSARPSDGVSNDAAKNLDKIRELIFGEEFRYLENRLNQIESSLTHEINQLKMLFDEHFKSLDRATNILAQQTRDRIESLTAQAQQEQARIGAQIREHHNTLYDMLAKATNELRAEKADRRMIAEIFSEMSKRILSLNATSVHQSSRYESHMP